MSSEAVIDALIQDARNAKTGDGQTKGFALNSYVYAATDQWLVEALSVQPGQVRCYWTGKDPSRTRRQSAARAKRLPDRRFDVLLIVCPPDRQDLVRNDAIQGEYAGRVVIVFTSDVPTPRERAELSLSFYCSEPDDPLNEQLARLFPDAESVQPNANRHDEVGDRLSGASRKATIWVEKTGVAGRPDRQSGPHALGKALWSPHRSKDGRRVYASMWEAEPGDVVLHFVDRKHFIGASVVAAAADETFEPPPDTSWSGSSGVRVALSDYVPLEKPIEREALFKDSGIAERLTTVLARYKNLFYNKKLELNEGGYLTEAPPELVEILNDVYREQTGLDLPHVTTSNSVATIATTLPETLTVDWLEQRTLWPRARLEKLIECISSQTRQIVLAGPPGTGKTWVAKHLARFLTQDRPQAVRIVQFHPSFSYEEFVEGLRPVSEEGAIQFRVVEGVVKRFARQEPVDTTRVLIIDEMNRANLSRVFGELMYLFEYREEEINLQYSDRFALPAGLLFVGTMNTADRSIRSIDIALRRRFDVFECMPDASMLERFYAEEGRMNDVPNLVDGFSRLNADLERELDKHHTVGHTFFMHEHLTRERLSQVWERQIGPLIEEYFFDQPDLATEFGLGRFWPETP